MGVIKNYFLNSSLHGLHFIADERLHWTERLFWTICVLGCWGASLALTLSAIEQYQSQKISFSADTSYMHWNTNFPAIVLCEKSNNKKIDEANKEMFREISSEHLPKLEYFVFYDGTTRYTEACRIGGIFRERCLLGNYSMYMNKFRSTCTEVIGSCYYNGEEFPCCDEFLPIPTYHGPCFAFNSLFSGKYNNRDQLPFKINHDITYGYGNLSIELLHTGFYVYGLSQDAVPTKDSSKEYALMDSGSKNIIPKTYYKTFLSVEETFADKNARFMSIENRGCRFYDENNLQHSQIYSTSTCENECLVEAQRSICNCTVHTLPHSEQVKECDYDGLLCILDNELILQKSKSCQCLSSCFDVEVKNIGFTKTNLKNEMLRSDKCLALIDFIVQPPVIRYRRSVVKNPLYMLVYIGGSVGVFLGASLLSIVEIIYYFVIRPLGDKYLEKEKNKAIKKSKEQQMDLLDGYYFEYYTDTFHGPQKMGIETRLIIHCCCLLNILTTIVLPLSRDIHYLREITVSL